MSREARRAHLAELWLAYGLDARPANMGERVAGTLLAELDDVVQDAVGSYLGLGPALGNDRVARLGLALAELTRLLPVVTPPETQGYFKRLTHLARVTLEQVAEPEG